MRSANAILNEIMKREEKATVQREFLKQYHFRPLQNGETVRTTDEERWEDNEPWTLVDRVFVGKAYHQDKMPDIRRKRS